MASRCATFRFSILPLALFASVASSAEFFVSPEGDNDNPGTSVSAPWRTIAKANSEIGPGDVVFLRGGKYLDDPIRPARSGTESKSIRYAAYQDEEPVLTSDSVGGLEVAIDLSGRSYITVQGVHVDGVRPNPKARVNHFVNIFDGSYNTIVDCTFRYAHGWHGIRLTDGAHHNRLLNNYVDVVGIYDDGTGQDWGDSIQIIGDAHHNLLEGNTLTRGSHNLLQVKGEFNVIRRNTFENDWSEILGDGIGGRNLELIGRRNVFEENIVRRASASVDKPANAGMKVEGRNNIVRRNYVYDNSNEGITTQSRSKQRWAEDNRIFHNTIYANGGAAWGLKYFGGNGVMGNVFKNNIVFGNGSTAIEFDLTENPKGVLGESTVESNLIVRRSTDDAEVAVKDGGGRMSLSQAEQKFAKNFRTNMQENPVFVASIPQKPTDFELANGSRGIDEAAPLTTTRSAGSGRVIPVKDAGYFTDGFSMMQGDRIRIGQGPALTIVEVDYSDHTITVAGDAEWEADAPVSLNYHGAGPDIGAVEAHLGGRLPRSPGALKGTVR